MEYNGKFVSSDRKSKKGMRVMTRAKQNANKIGLTID